ncbi:DUF4037 domain-containing protein [Granulicatella balaenopterae]|nr:DUF4037 domain-containing protein [Granulicatella balaenopterae]
MGFGMDLARSYYYEELKPLLSDQFPNEFQYMAIGLVGHGSECYGYDDRFSADHDYGKRAMIFLPREIFKVKGREIFACVEEHTSGQCDVMSIGAFYKLILANEVGPQTNDEWIYLRESALSTASNGEVFIDNLGEFTRIRENLLAYYPEDVRKYKLAHQLFKMAQSGQYNYQRSIKRKELSAAKIAEADFIRHACMAVHMLNKRYCPYYKWSTRSLKDLPILGAAVETLLNRLNNVELRVAKELSDKGEFSHITVFEEVSKRKIAIFEQVSNMIISYLIESGLSSASSDFLLDHAVSVKNSIEDRAIRDLSIYAEGLEVR